MIYYLLLWLLAFVNAAKGNLDEGAPISDSTKTLQFLMKQFDLKYTMTEGVWDH